MYIKIRNQLFKLLKIETHIEWFSFFLNLKSIMNLPSLFHTNAKKEFFHLFFKKWREIIGKISKSNSHSRKALIERFSIWFTFYVKLPWLYSIDILIELCCKSKTLIECTFEIIGFHIPDIFWLIVISFSSNDTIFISRKTSSEFEWKCKNAIKKISEIVGKFCIVLEDCFFLIEVSIFSNRKSGKKIEYEHISRIGIDIFHRINDISDWLGHFLSINRKKSSCKKSRWWFISNRMKHCWPIYCMKFGNILSDHMKICWPPLILLITTNTHIVQEGIIPDICDLTRIKRKWNSKGICFTRDGKILKSSLYEFSNFIVARRWNDKVRMFLIKI